MAAVYEWAAGELFPNKTPEPRPENRQAELATEPGSDPPALLTEREIKQEPAEPEMEPESRGARPLIISAVEQTAVKEERSEPAGEEDEPAGEEDEPAGEEDGEQGGYYQIKLCEAGETSGEWTRSQDHLNQQGPESEEGDNNGHGLFFCMDCGEVFMQRAVYQAHRRTHAHERRTDRVARYEGMLVPDAGRKTFSCAICGKRFYNSRGFHGHQRTHLLKQPKRGQEDKPHRCTVCGKGYIALGFLISHERSHEKPPKSIFNGLAQLKKKSFECPDCGRCYSRASALEAHRHCHANVKLFKALDPIKQARACGKAHECPECGKACHSVAGLSCHRKIHSVNLVKKEDMREESRRSLECLECGRTFASAAAIRAHRRVHALRSKSDAAVTPAGAEKPCACPVCRKRFCTPAFLEYHRRLAHADSRPPKSLLHQLDTLQKKSFKCPECGKRFSRASAFHSHLRCHTDYDSCQDVQEGSTSAAEEEEEASRSVCLSPRSSPRTARRLLAAESLGKSTQSGRGDSFECLDCSMYFTRPSAFHAHRLWHSSVSSVAPAKLEVKPEAELEIELEEEPDLKLKSPDCGKRFGLPASLRAHRLSHKRDGIAPYEIKPDIKSEVESEPETEVEPKKNPFECLECGQCFSCSKALLTHQHWHTRGSLQIFIGGSPTQSEKPYQCDECGKGYCSVKAFHNHLWKHMDRKPLKSLSYQLAGLEKNSFECPQCGMRFSRASALQSHKQSHLNARFKSRSSSEKPFKCAECGRGYWSPAALSVHQKSQHASAKPSLDPCQGREKSDAEVSSNTPDQSDASGKGNATHWGLDRQGRLHPHLKLSAHSDVRQGASSQEKSDKALHCGSRNSSGSALQSPYSTDSSKSHKESSSSHFDSGGRPPDEPVIKLEIEDFAIGSTPSKQVDPFECPDCGQRFACRGALCAHCHGRTRDSRHLSLLGRGTDVKTELKPEVKHDVQPDAELKDISLACPDCGRLFSRPDALRAHRYWHTRGSSRLSLFTGSTDVKPDIKLEIKTVLIADSTSPKKPFSSECPDCGKSFRNVAGLRSHMHWHRRPSKQHSTTFSHEGGPAPGEKPYRCDECGKGCDSIKAVHNHQRKHRKPLKSLSYQLARLERNSFECPECGMRFSRASALQSHNQNHLDSYSRSSKDKPYRCTECKKSYWSLRSLYTHKKCHLKEALKAEGDGGTQAEKPCHKCPDCQRSFSDPTELATHRQGPCVDESWERDTQAELGGKDGPLKSSRCGKGFHDSNAVCEHQLHQHMDEKTVLQKQPEKSLASPDRDRVCAAAMPLAGLHRRSHQLGEDSNQKPYPCPDCEKSYSSAGALHNHKKSGHKKPGNSVDSQETAPRSRRRRPHRFTNRSYQCQDCGKRYSTKSALYNHKKSHIAASVPDLQGAPQQNDMPFGRGAEPRKCQKCGNSFTTGSLLNTYRKQAWNSPSSCSLCCKTELEIKLEEEPDLEPKSPDCGKRFGLPAELRAHRLSHKRDCVTSYELKPDIKSEVEIEPETELEPKKDPFKCPECGQCFSCSKALLTHQHWHTRGSLQIFIGGSPTQSEKPYQCDECGKGYCSIKAFCDHLRKHMVRKPLKSLSYQLAGLEKNSFECPECGMRFSRASALQSHKQNHLDSHSRSSKDKPCRCTECEKSFWSLRSLYTHKKCHVKEALKEEGDGGTQAEKPCHKCPNCQRSFSDPAELATHRQGPCVDESWERDTKAELGGEDGPLQSSRCAEGFHDSNAVSGHQQHQHTDKKIVLQKQPEKSRACPDRDRVCAAAMPLAGLHLRSHQVEEDSNQKPYPCPDCEKSYSSAGALHNHKKSGHKKPGNSVDSQETAPRSRRRRPHRFTNRSYQCQDCGKRYSTKSALYNHKKSHIAASVPDLQGAPQQNDMPFGRGAELWKCQKCGKSFTTSSLLNAHRKQAWNSRYTCSLCCKGFPEEGELLQHMQRGHECRVCGMLFRALAELRLHLETHPGARPFRCLTCGLAFSHLKNLTRHQKNHSHQGVIREGKPMATPKRHKCPQCGKAFRFLSEVKRHQPVHTREKQQCQLCPKAYSLTQGLRVHQRSCHRAILTQGASKGNGTLSAAAFISSKPHEESCLLDNIESRLNAGQANCSTRGTTDKASELSVPSRAPKCFLSVEALQFSSDLVSPQPVHAGEKYRCQLCPKAYSKPQALRAHQQTLHGGDGTQGANEGEGTPQFSPAPEEEEGEALLLGCIECGQTFSQELELHQHYIEHARGDF
ncbi:zinc finger protein 646-like [Polyodon spathula]|uniref:zinc finger protein 646-like n=1 Tax=Polyodon spathula TaxID=7913 RepID=UPI001B7F74BF|nr:zinc finger protein 646-like [Polyodon spathula]